MNLAAKMQMDHIHPIEISELVGEVVLLNDLDVAISSLLVVVKPGLDKH